MCMKDFDDRKIGDPRRLYSVPGPAECGGAGACGPAPGLEEEGLRDMFSPQDLSTVATVTFLRLVDSPRDCIAYLAAVSLLEITNG